MCKMLVLMIKSWGRTRETKLSSLIHTKFLPVKTKSSEDFVYLMSHPSVFVLSQPTLIQLGKKKKKLKGKKRMSIHTCKNWAEGRSWVKLLSHPRVKNIWGMGRSCCFLSLHSDSWSVFPLTTWNWASLVPVLPPLNCAPSSLSPWGITWMIILTIYCPNPDTLGRERVFC